MYHFKIDLKNRLHDLKNRLGIKTFILDSGEKVEATEVLTNSEYLTFKLNDDVVRVAEKQGYKVEK